MTMDKAKTNDEQMVNGMDKNQMWKWPFMSNARVTWRATL